MNSKSTISNAIVGDVEPLLQAVNKIQALIQLRYGTWCVYINTYSLTLPISIEAFISSDRLDTCCPLVPHDPIYNSELNILHCTFNPMHHGPLPIKTHKLPGSAQTWTKVRIALVELQKKPD